MKPQGEQQAGQVARVNVLGVGISALTLRTAVAAMLEAVAARRKGYICVTGVHGVSEAQQDPAFRSILNRSFLTTPDGVPMVWMGRLQGFREMTRVYGPDLMLEFLEASRSGNMTHFFYGGAPGVAEELKARMEARFPGTKVAGVLSPPFRPLTAAEAQALAHQVAELKPDVFWIGLSTPKQERFMADFWERLDATLFVGVGAAFDFHTGRTPQAPRWMQRSGLEWLFRLACEPRRLGKRYLKNNPLFVWRALLQLSGLRRYELNSVSSRANPCLPMTNQPVPVVTRADVERVVRRDYPASRFAEVLAVLNEYGAERWQPEAHRVHLAVLKLARGNLAHLRREVATAKMDYRDVLAPAEYPSYGRMVFNAGELSPDEVQRIIDADWQQYQRWLNQ